MQIDLRLFCFTARKIVLTRIQIHKIPENGQTCQQKRQATSPRWKFGGELSRTVSVTLVASSVHAFYRLYQQYKYCNVYGNEM